MIRTIKLLGLTVTAALLASAMLASGAPAEEGAFTTGTTVGEGELEHKSARVVGQQYGNTQSNFLTSPAGNFTCDHAEYEGIAETGTETSLTLTPHYTDCYKFSENEVGEIVEENPLTVTTNNCDLLFTSPDTIEEGAAYTGGANLECQNAGEEVVTHIYSFGSSTNHFFNACTISVEQFEDTEVGGHIVYQNKEDEAGNKDVTAKATITEIPYTHAGSCGIEGETTRKDYTIVSTVTVGAESQVDHEPTTIEGSKIGGAQSNYFSSPGGKITCDIAEYHSSSETGTANDFTTSTPHYTDCYKFTENESGEIEGENPATVTTGDCDYGFSQATTIEEGVRYTGGVSLECAEPEEELVIHIYGFGSPTSHFFDSCTISFEQFDDEDVNGHVVVDTSLGAAGHGTVEMEIGSVPYTHHGSCGIEGATTQTNGSIVSMATAEGLGSPERTDALISD